MINGVDICIYGFDFIVSYLIWFGEWGWIDWCLGVNVNCMKLVRNYCGCNG